MIELLDRFVLVRITSTNEVDLSTFQFDYDVTWMGFFLDANDRVISRYGGRDGTGPDARLSLDGLKTTMRRVLDDQSQPSRRVAAPHQPVFPADLFEVKGKCLHCHQVWEGIRKRARKEKRFDPESLYVYPAPETIGLELDVMAGNQVVRVADNSAAQRAGLRANDVINSIQVVPIFSQGDVMWALHNAPREGNLTVRYLRDGKPRTATLKLAAGWKHTDLSWRPSMKKEKK